MSGSRRGRRHGWERERWKERHEREKKERKRDRDGREKDREAGAGERDIGREIGVGERERETGGKIRRDRGEREKITSTKKFMEFYLVVLYSAERSEARQWIVARQVTCYNPLSCFNPVTREKMGKKKIERETGWER